jgi:hypothetical protein
MWQEMNIFVRCCGSYNGYREIWCHSLQGELLELENEELFCVQNSGASVQARSSTSEDADQGIDRS